MRRCAAWRFDQNEGQINKSSLVLFSKKNFFLKKEAKTLG
jgi:hypothetical protein